MASMFPVATLSSTLATISTAQAISATWVCSTSSALLLPFQGLRCRSATLPLKAAKPSSAEFGWYVFSSIAPAVGNSASKRVVRMRSQEEAGVVGFVGVETGRTSSFGTTDSNPKGGNAVADLLVVGPGVLGSLVAQMWLKGNDGSTVVGQTNSIARHEDLKSLGIVPVVKDDPQNSAKFPYVIFCAPPSGSLDYAMEVRAAAQRWNGEGSFLFTSSSALYDVDGNSICDEEIAPTVPRGRGPRTDTLLDAEAEVLSVGGNVVRLAGLYLLNRGAHTFYLRKGTVDGRPDYTLNLIHYEDAASLCIAIMKGISRGRVYMGTDNSPLTREEMMEAVSKSRKFEQQFKEFTGVDGPRGKKMYNNSTRNATGWKPRYESFPSFLGL